MTNLRFDHLDYARCHGMWIGRRKCAGFPTEYWICKGDHPHDPDGESEVLAGPRPTTETEAIAQAKSARLNDLKTEITTLENDHD